MTRIAISDRLPVHLRPFFWEYRLAELSWSRDRDFITSRILQAGDWPAITWLRGRLGDEALRTWLQAGGARGLDSRRRNFWNLVLDIRSDRRTQTPGGAPRPPADPAWERRTR
jgi:hypothetical protein